MDVSTLDYILRILGRIGFMLVLIGVYRLWHLPVLRRHSNQFFWLVTTLFGLNVILGLIEAIFPQIAVYELSFYFNIISTWILAIHLNYRVYMIKRKVSKKRIAKFTFELNQKIEELKNETR